MNIKNHNDLIYEIDNFLNASDHQSLLTMVNENLAHDFTSFDKKTNNYIIVGWDDDSDIKAVHWNYEIAYQIEELIKSIFINNIVPTNFEVLGVNTISCMLLYPKNHFKEGHRDRGGDESIEFGCVYYINDDYEGGEIIYPDLQISIKPKANTLILHKSDLIHHTAPIQGDKVKAVMTTFLKSKAEKK